jgi:hypothetical protein
MANPKYAKKRAEAVAPYLEPGETVRESFLAQTPVPPWVFLLIAGYVFIFVQKYRTVAATDRNIYVMHNAWMRSYRFDKVAHKVPLSSARIESGGSWMTVDGGPKLRVPPFGPIKRSMHELLEYVENARGALPETAGATEAAASPAAPAAPAAGPAGTPPQGTPPPA